MLGRYGNPKRFRLPGRSRFLCTAQAEGRYRIPTGIHMDTAAVAIKQDLPSVAPADLVAVKARQRVAWSSGDYAVVGTTLQIVGEELAEALDLRSGQRVLDVAAGNVNATLAAARRGCHVTSTDYVPALLERAGERAAADRLSIDFREADAENLPFEGGAFDAVMSTFGVMFTPDQDRAASELMRVCRGGFSSERTAT